jgi:hypothetical protein
MASHGFELQKAIYSALNGDAALSALVTGVYDDVPEGTAYPYVVLGEDTGINFGSKTLDGLEYTLTIHAWSQYRGRKEVKEIMEAIYDALHDASLSVTDATLVNIRQEFETTLMDADGLTRHGVMRFRAVVFDD